MYYIGNDGVVYNIGNACVVQYVCGENKLSTILYTRDYVCI